MPEQSSLKEQIGKLPQILFLPHVEENEKDFMSKSWSDFSYERLVGNIKLINGLSARDLSENEQKNLEYWKDKINHQFKQYEPRLQGLARAPDIKQSLRTLLPVVEMRDKPVSAHHLSNYLATAFSRNDENLVLLSDSHLSTYSVLEALEQLGLSKLGLVVFDRHHDFYFTWADKLALSYDHSVDLGKRNFLRFALDEQKVRAVSIIGPPQEEVEKLLLGEERYAQLFEPTHLYLKEHSASLQVVNEKGYRKPNGSFDYGKFEKIMIQQVAFLRNAGVKNILFSVDFDALRLSELGYTPTEYNPLALMMYLGSTDFSHLDKDILQYIQEKNTLKNGQTLDQELELRRTSFFLNTLSRSSQAGMKLEEEGGLPLLAIAKGIEYVTSAAERQSLNVGVRLPGGGKLLFDITELSARDYKSHTAKAVNALIRQS